ncbi:MAG: glutathione S-transferase N-terminal domain-containing protein [Pigmentiphaga sp.]|nr:glutathione S-transferase N-terminal domain-containing protein [Pigmentiphaga sp.]
MIELHTWDTSNGRKVAILLEELQLPYRIVPIDLGANEQHSPAFLRLNPYGKIPAMIDQAAPGGEPVVLFESGAMLLYLHEKTGRLLPADPAKRPPALSWMFFGLASAGPVLAELHHYHRHAREQAYGVERARAEARRVYDVLEQRLATVPFLGGDDYSLADIATFPWIARHDWQEIDLGRYPHVQAWYAAVGSRPAVVRGMTAMQRHG